VRRFPLPRKCRVDGRAKYKKLKQSVFRHEGMPSERESGGIGTKKPLEFSTQEKPRIRNLSLAKNQVNDFADISLFGCFTRRIARFPGFPLAPIPNKITQIHDKQ
jgi:hypothetical protein